MRDSWIDKDEFDELVQAFSPSKKGRKRSPHTRAPKRGRTKEPEEIVDPVTATEELQPPPQEDYLIEETDPLAISSIDLIDEYASSETLQVNDQENVIAEWDVTQVEIVEEMPLPEAEQVVEKIVDEKDGNIQERSERFLSGEEPEAEEEKPLVVGGSVADAVKAVKALAEARDKVDRGGLIRKKKEPQMEPIEEEGIPGPTEDSAPLPPGEDGPGPVEDPLPFTTSEPEEEISFVDDVEGEELFSNLPLDSSAKKETDFSREGTIRQRLAKFADLLHQKLDATDVVVMDAEGFPLYQESNGTAPARIEKSGGPYRLVHNLREIAAAAGLEDRVSTQVFMGNGQWLCLLYSAETNDDGPMVRAVLPEALENRQLQKWSNLLGAALLLNESHSNSSDPAG